MKYILFVGLLLVHILQAGEIPILRFDDRVTWKQIFDSGFRPKHLEGLERNTCVSQNQSFWVEFKGRESKFKVQNGRVSFSFLYDDFLSMVWHQGAEAITLEEGKRRADEFRKVFDGYIAQEITMPPLIDPSGLVDAGNAENNIQARVGEYRITYGFDNSMGKVKPIIPHFYITWSFPGMPDSRLKDSGDVVRPPAGYEWYSLDPKVHTPDPSGVVNSKDLPEISSTQTPESTRPERREKSPEATPPQPTKSPWPVWIVLLALIFPIGLLLKRRFSKE